MIRTGFCSILIVFLCALLSLFAANDAAAQGPTGNPTGGINPVVVDSFHICLGETIFDTLDLVPDIPVDSLTTLRIVSGPGSLQTVLTQFSIMGFYEYLPPAAGSYEVTYALEHNGALITNLFYTYVVFANSAPVLGDQGFAAAICDSGTARQLFPQFVNPEQELLAWTMLSGSGSIGAGTGTITYTVDTSGVYSFLISVADSCGADTALITDTVHLNTIPWVRGFDSTIYLCAADQICFEVQGIDPDGNPLGIGQETGPGSFTMLSDSSGQTCFWPAAVDSAVYTFTYCADDYCGQLKAAAGAWLCDEDTVRITVLINRPPQIVCPSPQTFYACQPDSFCFTIDANDPEFGPMTFSVLSGNAAVSGKTVCVFGDQSTQMDVVIEVVDECGLADTCVVPVTIQGNRVPYVTMAADFSLFLCAAQTVCFAATADDPDFDLADVFSNIGYYDSNTNRICFNADTAGVYELILTAIDSCGAVDMDTTIVTINLPGLPVVNLGQDIAIDQCGLSEICFPVTIEYDSLSSLIIDGPGTYNSLIGQICFTPTGSGSYIFTVSAEDFCSGTIVADTVEVTVSISSNPWVNLGADIQSNNCGPTEVCVDVAHSSPFISITTNIGSFDPQTDQICFTPQQSGTYAVIATLTDSCGSVLSDTVDVGVTITSSPPQLTAMPDSTVRLCAPVEICLPITVSDPDNDIASISVNQGSYNGSAVCFVPYDSGTYEIILTATDSCGNVVADTAMVTVITDQGVSIVCPPDTSVFTCKPDTFCFPIGGIPAGSQVSVTGINTWYDSSTQSVCFYSECSNTNNIVVTVATACGSHSCSFTVNVLCNSSPLVILSPDTVVEACGTTEVCVPVGISDVDGNIQQIVVDGGTFDPTYSVVCVQTDTSGVYRIAVTVTDECGDSDFDEIFVTVTANNPPQIQSILADSLYSQCSFESICLPVTVFDSDSNLASITSSLGTYDSQQQAICFTPDSSGVYCLEVYASDSCGLTDTAQVCLVVELSEFVLIDCPIDTIIAAALCGPDTVCIPLNVTGINFQVTTSIGYYTNGQLCFFADTGGVFTIDAYGTAQCNSDTCRLTVMVGMNEPVAIACPNDTSVFLCGPDTVYLPFTASSSIQSVTASDPAFISGQQVGVPVSTAGDISVTLTGTGACATASCTFTLTSLFNSPPTVTAPADTVFEACGFQELCLPFSFSDLDSNIVEVASSQGTVQGDTLCYTPTSVGTHQIILSVTDSCGLVDKDTLTISITSGGSTFIVCPPGPVVDTICQPDSVCVPAPVTPAGATVTVLPEGSYNPVTGMVCVYFGQAGTKEITVISEVTCATDTCRFTMQAVMQTAPTISCPVTLDTLACMSSQTDICVPATVTGTGVQVTVSPIGSYANGQICLPIDTAGVYDIEVVAENFCGADTCHLTVTATANQAPQLFVPQGLTFERCPDDTNRVCVDSIFATDFEGPVTLTMVSGNGTFGELAPDNFQVCFRPDSIGPQLFVFEASDGCNATIDTLVVDFTEKPNCDVCVRMTIDGGACTPVGVRHEVALMVETNDPIGGFNLLMSFDASVMVFLSATIEATEVEPWEYFTFGLNDGNCGGACPSGLLRLVAIADMNNGPLHPPAESLNPNGTLVRLQFQLSSDQNLGDQFLPISFVWYDCGDNAFSDPSGNTLFIESRIFNSEGILLWDEADDITYPEPSRPFGLGAGDICMNPDSGKPSP
ncbi:MAG: hypothetical protein ACE5FH_06225, partial [Candidatus Zixiibacteriota bacterium]